MRPDDLLKKLEDRPFRPFRVHLSDGTVLNVADPGDVVVGRATAMCFTRYGRTEQGRRIVEDWRTIALMHITQFSEIKRSRNGRRPKHARGA